MKKTKTTLGLMVSLLSCAALAGCNEVTYSPNGYILTYTNSAGETLQYTADDLFGSYYEDSSKVSTMFDSIYKLIVRNYFTEENAGHDKYSEILKNAKNDVEGVKSKADENAETNSTDYDKEFDTLLASYSCKDEAELLEHFIYERELKEFNEQFYDNNTEFLRDSKPTAEKEGAYKGYIYSKLPYHVRHILVKVSDTGSTNFWNSTIDSSDAIQLSDVATSLARTEDTFGKVAKLYSDDSSASSYGDLGIMDKDTSFVNEFKLGVYAYENLFNNATKSLAGSTNIGINANIASEYKSTSGTTIGKIPFAVFDKLSEVNDIIKDDQNRDVNDGNASFFPRNVYFNKYLNKHYVSVITPELLEGESGANPYTTLPGFNRADVNGDGLGNILRTSDGQPILAVRSGTSDYQGIHFIVVQRTPLIDTVSDVSLSDYYTTKYPGQSGYPTKEDRSDKQTYVNFLNLEQKDLKTRAETVENKIKNFDSNLNKFIYSKYLEEEKISFKDKDLEKTINKWIDSAKVKSEFDEKISWEKTWDSYIETLKVQESERSKLIPEACAIGFATHTGADWIDGGQCYDNKNR